MLGSAGTSLQGKDFKACDSSGSAGMSPDHKMEKDHGGRFLITLPAAMATYLEGLDLSQCTNLRQ